MSGVLTLAGIVRALGGELYAGGRRACVRGPGHGPADRSVSLALQNGRVLIHCFAGDDWRDVRRDLIAWGLVDAQGRLRGSGSWPDPGKPPPGRAHRQATVRRLWEAGRPVQATLSEAHLARRGVAPPSEGLRHHPGVPSAVYDWCGPERPALLAAIRDPDSGELTGVELTYLAPNGDRARLAVPRKTIGACPYGAAVRLAPMQSRLLVGEGVFTCLSAAARFGLPAWALLSANNLRRWRPPPGVTFVLIAADRGTTGEAAARVLRARLRDAGVVGVVRWPPAPFGDWNEAAVQAGREEGE